MKNIKYIALPILAVALTLNGVFEFSDYMDYAATNQIKQYGNDRYYIDLKQAQNEKEIMEAYENMTPEQRIEGVVYE